MEIPVDFHHPNSFIQFRLVTDDVTCRSRRPSSMPPDVIENQDSTWNRRRDRFHEMRELSGGYLSDVRWGLSFVDCAFVV